MADARDDLARELLDAFCRTIYLAVQLATPPEEEAAKHYYTRGEAADELRISTATFDRYRKNGQIEPDHHAGTGKRKFPRFAQADIDRLRQIIEERRKQ